MLELFLAFKYLIPTRRSLSAALISLVSVFVITLVVWLVLVFLSVISGLEDNWIKKLTHLSAPVRIVPTQKYFDSYYYRIDSLASSSEYTPKTLQEKAFAKVSDPHRPEIDMPIPHFWPKPQMNNLGELLDPVKELNGILSNQLHLSYQDYEIASGLLKLRLQRPMAKNSPFETSSIKELSQMSYLFSFPNNNPNYEKLFCQYRAEDLNHLIDQLIIPHNQLVDILKSKNDLRITGNNPFHQEQDFDEIEFVSGNVSFDSSKMIKIDNAHPIALPKNYQNSGVLIGDKGVISFIANTATSTKEQLLPVIVSGFFDPGLVPIGSKFVLVDKKLTKIINSFVNTLTPDGTPTNGYYVWLDDYHQADEIKTQIVQALKDKNIGEYWKIETYKEFEFAKNPLQQFQSDRLLFTLIGIIILIVACSNIISLSVLLVNDKRKEIATLQALGAPKRSIITIFGLCGMAMGLLSLALGSIAALFTLKNIDVLVSFLSMIQGHNAFNKAFFGDMLPNGFSVKAWVFIAIATPIISIVAGIIPAIKASKVRPSTTLRS